MERTNEEHYNKLTAEAEIIAKVTNGDLLQAVNYLVADNSKKDNEIKKLIAMSKIKERKKNGTDKRLFTKVFHASLMELVRSGKLSFADRGFILSCIPFLSKIGNALIDAKTETVIKTIKVLAKNLNQSPRTIEARIKSLEDSGTGILARTPEGYFLDIEQIYFTRQAPKPIPLTKEEQEEVEEIYQEMM